MKTPSKQASASGTIKFFLDLKDLPSPHPRALRMMLLAAVLVLGSLLQGAESMGYNLYARTNLVAWCVVPFDAKKRGPEERAMMLERLGLRKLAYDWREEHVATFDQEIEAMKKHGIDMVAWWFPSSLDATAHRILRVLERHQVKAQLWVTMGDPLPEARSQEDKIKAAASVLGPMADAASKIGCSVALYNHGGWFGEPTNQVAIVQNLQKTNVGIVYNLHHGHEHLDRFAELFLLMKPHLLAFNLNGMIPRGDQLGKKILTIGQGTEEARLLKVIRESGWQGPVGIIDHRPETDSEITLLENLKGLENLLRQ
ncbi:MAG TPA: TIM barrel protein [Candidatus Paceibacterota bacterium]|nr:TIM barrel protein [Verrucomicrobiota bacterium]HRY48885.1 TIM barrel protein [Candidatus Paceibacterota bacterium]HSA00691.1 TIM barrel protein [Candidatus Paceibacterota bacterium]